MKNYSSVIVGHKTLREKVTKLLREKIIRQHLQPGEKITEIGLGERLGVSRTPIREAFLQLEAEGFLTITPRKGVIVSNIRESGIREFYEIRGVLEGYAARCAAALVTPNEIARLEKYNRKFMRLATSRQTNGMDMVRAHNDFHEFILKLCGNRKMLEIYSGLGQKFIRFRFMAAVMVQIEDIKQNHGEIIEALRTGDGPRAEEAVRKNAERGLAALLQALATTHKNLGSAA